MSHFDFESYHTPILNVMSHSHFECFSLFSKMWKSTWRHNIQNGKVTKNMNQTCFFPMGPQTFKIVASDPKWKSSLIQKTQKKPSKNMFSISPKTIFSVFKNVKGNPSQGSRGPRGGNAGVRQAATWAPALNPRKPRKSQLFPSFFLDFPRGGLNLPWGLNLPRGTPRAAGWAAGAPRADDL